jgi:TonB family protein
MSFLHRRAYRRIPATIVSLMCHLAAIAVLIAGVTRPIIEKSELSKLRCVAALQFAGGSQALRLPLSEEPPARHSAKRPPVRESATRPALEPRERPSARSSGTIAANAQLSDHGTNSVAGNGNDTQNTTPAFPIFYPNPAVHDRSLLPRSEQQVIVDVQLTDSGRVISDNLVKGIGNALDRMAIEIVKTWLFQPATVNGKAVPSEAEVIFSFGQRYPVSDS